MFSFWLQHEPKESRHYAQEHSTEVLESLKADTDVNVNETPKPCQLLLTNLNSQFVFCENIWQVLSVH